MAGKKISTMAEMLTPTNNTWITIVDLDEANPELQNKKMKQLNATPDAHVQNTDQYLDQGGPWETAASAAYLGFLSSSPMYYLQNEGGALNVGYARVAATVGGNRIIDVNGSNYANLDLSAFLVDIPQGTYLWIKSYTKSSLVKVTSVFALTGGWYRAVGNVITESSPDVFDDGKVLAINIQI